MKNNHPAILGIAMILAMSGCSDSGADEATDAAMANANAALAAADEAMAAANAALADATTPAPILSEKDQASVCKAGVAQMFGHSPSIMKASALSDGIIRVSYQRPDDRKTFRNDCAIKGRRINWRSVDGSPGRWRTDPADEVLNFKVIGNMVDIKTTYSDGSTATEKQPMI